MTVFTAWPGTPIRDWLGRNIPGAQALGNIVGQDPRYSALNQQVRGAIPSQAAEKTPSYDYSQDISKQNMSVDPNYPYNTPTSGVKGEGGVKGVGTTGIVGTNIDTTNINQNVSTGNDAIDRDYNDFLNQLGGAEQGLRSQAGVATSAVGTNYAPVRTALEQEQATKLGGLEEQRQVATTQEKTGMQGARDLFRQTQQQNIAQVAGMGISSSSVTEALAENLGVETARRIASISQSANDIYQNLAKEKTNVETYVKAKIADMEGKIAQEKDNIQLSLMEGLRQINEARATAAKDKANRRADLLQNAQNAIYQLQQNAQTFAQSLEMWRQQNTAGINAAVSGKDWNSIFSGMLTNAPSISGFTATPSYNVSKTGELSGQIGYEKTVKQNPYDPQKQPNEYNAWDAVNG